MCSAIDIRKDITRVFGRLIQHVSAEVPTVIDSRASALRDH